MHCYAKSHRIVLICSCHVVVHNLINGIVSSLRKIIRCFTQVNILL